MRALVVRKTPKLDVLVAKSPDRVEQLRTSDPVAFAALVDAAAQQARANSAVADALAQHGVEATHLTRDNFEGVPDGVDLVVVVGGDGTVLDVSHRVGATPILGINSDPGRSVGYFCAARAEEAQAVVRRFVAGDARVYALHRISMTVDGAVYPWPCMNDLLVANSNPAMMSRYVLTAGERSEVHASSGIWISTPAGSTAGIRSAGGTVMPLQGALIQYLVREPYVAGASRYPLLRGVRHIDEGLEIRSLMDGGMVYVDGPYMAIPFPLGATLALTPGPRVHIVDLNVDRRER